MREKQDNSLMKHATNLEHRASSSWSKHEGESSLGLCDRLDRTRDNSQRQLPTDHDYAVPTREYQTDQSSLKTAPTAARSVFGKSKRKPPKQTHRSRPVDTVTPYQALALIEQSRAIHLFGKGPINRLGGVRNWTHSRLHVQLKCAPSTSDSVILHQLGLATWVNFRQPTAA